MNVVFSQGEARDWWVGKLDAFRAKGYNPTNWMEGTIVPLPLRLFVGEYYL